MLILCYGEVAFRVCCDLRWVVLIVSPKDKDCFLSLSQMELNEIMRRVKLLNVLEKSEVEVSFSTSEERLFKNFLMLRNISKTQMGRVIVVMLEDCFYDLQFRAWSIVL